MRARRPQSTIPVPAAPQQSKGLKAQLELPAKRTRAPAPESGADQRRVAPKKEMDPLRWINALSITVRLRNAEEFEETLQEAQWYEDDDLLCERKRDASRDPTPSGIYRSQRRLDVVGMAIERRIWHEEVEDDLVDAINCYSDSSPVVGTELQGMVVDICRADESVRRVWLPGGSIFYGQQNAICKVMCFLWSCFLVFGPELRHLRYFCDRVVCWTTDGGVESKCIELPDCLDAFFAWIGGRALDDCARLVHFGRRLFWRSMRILGWNHGFGNIALRVAKSYMWWPEILTHIQHLCKFFRYATWREWLQKALKARLPEVVDLLHSFTATTAKWRFATIIWCMESLAPLRNVCENFLCAELFQDAQEKVFIEDVLKACKDPSLWLFIRSVGPHVMSKLEHCRRWGLCCSHQRCNDLRHSGVHHVDCPQNGRRLAEAWPWLKIQIHDRQESSRQLPTALTENNDDWNKICRDMCSKAAAEIRSTWKHLGQVPWAFSRADTVEGALDCIVQVSRQSLDLHDPATRYFVQTVGNDLKARSEGGELTTDLAREVRRWKHASLNEMCGTRI